MEFYKVLLKIMEDKNLKMSDVARLSNLPSSTIRSIIGKQSKNVRLDVAFKLSEGLDVPLEYLNGEFKNTPEIIINKDDEKELLTIYRELNTTMKKSLSSISKELLKIQDSKEDK